MNREKSLPILDIADGGRRYVRNLKALSQHRWKREFIGQWSLLLAAWLKGTCVSGSSGCSSARTGRRWGKMSFVSTVDKHSKPLKSHGSEKPAVAIVLDPY